MTSAKRVPHFKPSKELLARVNHADQSSGTTSLSQVFFRVTADSMRNEEYNQNGH